MRWTDLCLWAVRTCPSSNTYRISNSSAVVPPCDVLDPVPTAIVKFVNSSQSTLPSPFTSICLNNSPTSLTQFAASRSDDLRIGSTSASAGKTAWMNWSISRPSICFRKRGLSLGRVWDESCAQMSPTEWNASLSSTASQGNRDTMLCWTWCVTSDRVLE